MPSVELRGVSKAFGRAAPLRDFSCHVPTGSFTLVSGPSGAGKTTLLRLIAGLELPDSGSILINNQVASGPRVYVPPHRRQLGMSFQDFALWPHKTVHGHLDFVLRAARCPRTRRAEVIAQLLALFELPDKVYSRPSTLSGGQQQRLNLARALASSPPLVLLDEPFAHLDQALRESILAELLRRNRVDGLTLIAAAHSHENLQEYATQVLEIA